MGLFKKKMEAVQREKLNETHEIVCLYCFQNFDHDKVLFQSAETDDIQHPSEYSEKFKNYHRGVLSALTDSHGQTATCRLCPYCFSILPQSAGFAPGAVIVFAGASPADKRTFFTALIHILKNVTPHRFPLFCTPLNNETGRRFKLEYEDPLIENTSLPELPQKEMQKENRSEPFVFTLSFADGILPEVYIAYVDDTERYAAYIRNASAVILMAGRQHNTETAVALLEVLGDGISQIPMAVVLGLEQNDAEAEEFLHSTEPVFCNMLKRRFPRLGFFTLPEWGVSPVSERVEEPFLWLLYQLGYDIGN
jgi:hypothetical protein